MTDKNEPVDPGTQPVTEASTTDEQELRSRRDFLLGLGKWSRAVIVGAVVGSGALLTNKPAEAGWLNRRGGGWGGGGWLNGRGGGGGWVNRRGGWGGGSWINRR